MSDATPERWLPIEDYEDLYLVSNHGNVRSLPHRTPIGLRGGKMLKPYDGPAGYPHVTLFRDGVRDRRKVHQVVLAAFIGPRPPGLLSRHLNGIKTDNRLVNLAYGTDSDNRLDDVRNGTHPMGSRPTCKYGHEYTPENTITDRRGHRHCRICDDVRRAKWIARNAASGKRCKEDDCEEPPIARDMCSRHYQEWQRRQAGVAPRVWNTGQCSRDGCEEDAAVKGRCIPHYNQDRDQERKNRPAA